MGSKANAYESGPNGARYVSYIRVSTERQGQSGLGLEAQQKTIAEFINRHRDAQLVGEFVEIESGKSASNRPQLAAAIKRCRLQGATLVVAKLDRLSRELWFITFIREFGVKFICADNPKIDELTLQILGAVAQHERKLISERTRSALAAAKARGVRLGNPNFMSVRNNDTKSAHAKIQKNSDKFAREVLPEIQKIIAEGVETLSGIADRLNTLRIETRRGRLWTPMAVRRVLQRKQSSEPLEDFFKL